MGEYEIPGGLRFTKEDEWVRAEGGELVVGVTDFAQSQLGDIVFVELPSVGTSIQAGAPFGTIESVKAVSDLFAPVSGEVIAINEALADAPERVNEACYGEGWLIRVRASDPAELERLLDGAAYQASIDAREA